MAAGDSAASECNRGSGDVLRMLRTGTTAEHAAVEQALALLDPELTHCRLAAVLDRLHGFWLAAEAGLDEWATRFPADAALLNWPQRGRAALYAADLRSLGSPPERSQLPQLPPVADTDEALGRLYVLEGSTLGGVFIDRHLAGLPGLSDITLRAFSPYGCETGAMWHAFRTATRGLVAAGADAAAVVDAARATFASLAGWCRSVAAPLGASA